MRDSSSNGWSRLCRIDGEPTIADVPTFPLEDDAAQRGDVRKCEGFSDAGKRYARLTHRAGVREATVHEVALAQVVQRARGATRRALWGLSTAAAAGAVGSNGRMRVRAVVRGAAGPTMAQPGKRRRAPISRSDDRATSRGRARPTVALASLQVDLYEREVKTEGSCMAANETDLPFEFTYARLVVQRSPATDAQLADVEARFGALPADYKRFLQSVNGGSPRAKHAPALDDLVDPEADDPGRCVVEYPRRTSFGQHIFSFEVECVYGLGPPVETYEVEYSRNRRAARSVARSSRSPGTGQATSSSFWRPVTRPSICGFTTRRFCQCRSHHRSASCYGSYAPSLRNDATSHHVFIAGER
jgi:hypothetical protein